MDLRYEASQLFQAAFGFNFPIFIAYDVLGAAEEGLLGALGVQRPGVIFSGIDTIPDFTQEGIERNYYNEAEAKSWMGTPIIFQAKLMAGNYFVYKNGLPQREAFETIAFPPATMFSFRRAKNIVRTNVSGSDGTVKEIFGFDDWVIDVRGLCLDGPDVSAKQQLEQLLNFERVADAIDVTGSQFAVRKIIKVVMEDWQDNVPQGKPGVIAFQCKLISDQPIELNLRI